MDGPWAARQHRRPGLPGRIWLARLDGAVTWCHDRRPKGRVVLGFRAQAPQPGICCTPDLGSTALGGASVLGWHRSWAGGGTAMYGLIQRAAVVARAAVVLLGPAVVAAAATGIPAVPSAASGSPPAGLAPRPAPRYGLSEALRDRPDRAT